MNATNQNFDKVTSSTLESLEGLTFPELTFTTLFEDGSANTGVMVNVTVTMHSPTEFSLSTEDATERYVGGELRYLEGKRYSFVGSSTTETGTSCLFSGRPDL